MNINKITVVLASIMIVVLLVFLGLKYVMPEQSENNAKGEDKSQTVKVLPKDYLVGKKILWLDSYHQGYEWSDGTGTGIMSVLKDTPVKLKRLTLNAKRKPDPESCRIRAKEIKEKIDEYKPDIIIASDDYAQKYVIVPYYKNGKIPVVFCGVNWSAEDYGYPASNVTGMIEVDLIRSLMEHLTRYAKGKRIAMVARDDLTERKMFTQVNERFFNGKMLDFLFSEQTFDAFTQKFIEAQKNADIVLLTNNAGIIGWEKEKAEKFFRENTIVPTGTINKWMAPFVLVTFYRFAEEQGQWAAEAALDILSGVPVSQIPITENKQGKLMLNTDIAQTLNVIFTIDILRNAKLYPESHK